MTAIVKLLAGLVLLVAAALFVWSLRGATEPLPSSVLAAKSTDAPAVAESEVQRDAPMADREAPAVPAAVVDRSHNFAYTLICRVVDLDGLPVEGLRVVFAPHGCALNHWPSNTPADGTVRLQWRAKVPAMAISVGVSGGVQALRTVNVRAGVEQQLALLGESPRSAQYRVRESMAADGSRTRTLAIVPDVPPCQRAGEAASKDCRSCHADAGARQLFDARLQAREGLHGEALFGDLLLPGSKLAAVGVKEKLIAEKTRARAVETLALGKRKVAPPAVRQDPGCGTIAGRVFGEDGKPVSGVTVIWSQAADLPLGRARTNKDGTFELSDVAPGTVELRAGGSSQGLARVPVQVFAGAKAAADANLRRGAVIRGRVLGADGKPLEGARVEYVAHEVPWSDGAKVAMGGVFELANLPGAGKLLLWIGNALPVAMEASVLPASGEVLLDLRARGAGGSRLRLRALLPDGLAEAAAEVRVWQQSSGCGAAMQKARDGAFELGGLCAGFYRVEVGGEAVGWVDLGEHWVDGLGVVDLGSVRLPTPGVLRLANVMAENSLELYLRRADLDVRAEFAVADRTELRLPAGRWLAMWKEGAVLREHEFEVRLGAETAIDLTNLAR